MSDGNVEEFDTALSGRAPLAAMVEPIGAAFVDDAFAALASFRVELPVPDQEALDDPGIAQIVAQSMADGLRPGADGWIDDDLAFCRPWGFAPDRVRVPTGVWHGTEDTLVPPAHASWLAAAVPAAEGHVIVGAGHFGPLREIESILRWLTH
jgi:pimeloyl-ACP methyl ester carboxylesterase